MRNIRPSQLHEYGGKRQIRLRDLTASILGAGIPSETPAKALNPDLACDPYVRRLSNRFMMSVAGGWTYYPVWTLQVRAPSPASNLHWCW